MAKDIFFTQVTILPSDWQITHKDRILLIGSCFTDEIGKRLEISGYKTMKNPFGTVYNPVSIANLLIRSAAKTPFEDKDVILSGEFYYLFQAHGDVRGVSIRECLQNANDILDKVNDYIKQTDVIIITLGTAWSYWYKEGDILMANCHKIPQKFITRRLLTVEQTVSSLHLMTESIKQINPSVRFLYTLSPVRHIKEGFYDKKLSKSVLSLAIDEVIRNNNDSYYFPSYEIVNDELRDYRFYAKDMVHINETAVDYIWQRFGEVYFSLEEHLLNDKYIKLHLMQSHRPFNPDSDGYKKHLQKIKQLQQSLII